MKKKTGVILLAVVLAALILLTSCNTGAKQTTSPQPTSGGSPAPAPSGDLVEKGYQSSIKKDKIVIRAVRPQTGHFALFEQTAFGPNYKMWVDMVNQNGGLYVKSLDRKLPIEMIVYDDASDIENATRLFEQIVSRDKPDLVLGPQSTGFLFACAPIAQKYGYLLLGAEGGGLELEKKFKTMREDYGEVTTFVPLSYSYTQVPAMIKLFQDINIKSVYCAYINDLHGIEYWSKAEQELKAVGIEIKGSEPVDMFEFMADSIINNAKNSGAQAFLNFTYPDQSFPLMMSAKQLGYNPDVFLSGPGSCYDICGLAAFGDYTNVALDGMMSWGAWNEKSNARAKEYSEMFKKYWIEKGEFWKNADGSFNPNGNVFQDWWGHTIYYSALQVLEQAVANAGELDSNGVLNQATLIKYVSTATFDTVLNPKLKFTNNILEDDMYLGNIGQWQNGIFEVIDADGRRTADPIVPKPQWK